MAKNETKHKSKWKEAKDTSKSLKPETRKDLKDYIKDLVQDCMWEFSGEIQPGTRKDDKWDKDAKSYPFVHNKSDAPGESQYMVPKRKDADNAYPIKMMQDGDPKMAAHAKKAFEKNIEKDTEDYLDAMAQRNTGEKLKENIEKLSESQKEKLVRLYVRNKIAKVLQEQELSIPAMDAPADAEAEAAPEAADAEAEAAPEAADAPEPAAAPEPEVDPKRAEEDQLQLIMKSPKLFSDYLELKKGDMNILKLVKMGIDPLLKSLVSIDTKQQHLAQLMIKKAVTNFKKDYQPDQDIPTSDASDLA